MKSDQASIQELMEFWNERENDLNNGDFINEINNRVDVGENISLQKLEVGQFIDVECSMPSPVVSENCISFSLGEMMRKEEVASQNCYKLKSGLL